MSFLCTVIALVAMLSQPQGLPPEYSEQFSERVPVVVEGFVGVEWPCGEEMCYAGLRSIPELDLVTGP